MKRNLREIGNYQDCIAPPPPRYSLVYSLYLLMTPMFSIFTLAIKFDCVFLIIFQSFDLFVSFIFNKLAPPPTH